MFPRDVSPAFTREMGCTTADWLRTLPAAVGVHALDLPAPGQARVRLSGGGTLSLHWQVLPERRIALAVLPRLQVDFAFDGVDADRRSAFMRLFDLTMQRGGG